MGTGNLTVLILREGEKNLVMIYPISNNIDGSVRIGDRVVIIDDTVTTGQTTIDAITEAKKAGLIVVKVLALVDRQEGGKENIEKMGVVFDSIFTKDDLIRGVCLPIKKALQSG